MEKVTTTIRLPADLRDAIQDLADSEMRSLSNQITLLLEAGFCAHSPERYSNMKQQREKQD
jgi:hypothetical protein